MEAPTLRQERRRYVRTSGLQVQVTIGDQYGHVFPAVITSLSAGGVAFFTETLPGSQVLEIRPAHSVQRIKVIAKSCAPVPFGYMVRCAFPFPPHAEILQILSASDLGGVALSGEAETIHALT
jgi:hypothetical protein